MKSKSNEEIKAFLDPIAEGLGLEIVEVEFKNSKNPSLTVYIDKDGGVDLDACEAFHNAIDALLDEFNPYDGAYTLNVSSPGIDRPLKTERDFLKKIGKDVEIKLYAPIKGVKYFEGTLINYDGNNVTVKIRGEDTVIPLNRIAKLNEAVKFD